MLRRLKPGDAKEWSMIGEIFFLSASVRDFASEAARKRFLAAWTRYYRIREPNLIFVDRRRDGFVAGYLMGCRDSAKATQLFRDIGSYGVFADYFDRFPAHFHVNCHPDFRGRGVGTELVTAFLEVCRDEAIQGVHIVTADAAQNVGFYEKMGFAVVEQRPWNDRRLLLMAKPLAAAGEEFTCPPRVKRRAGPPSPRRNRDGPWT